MLLLLKLILAPTLVAVASLLGRRFGPRAVGAVAGFPIVAGPVLLFFAIEQGAEFAAAAATQTLPGFISLGAFFLAYNWSALKWAWPLSLLTGWGAFTISTLVLSRLPLPLFPAWLIAVASLALTYKLLPRRPAPTTPPPRTHVDIALRMAATAGIVLLLTSLADRLGSTISGLLAPFPVASSVLVVFAHRQQGANAVEGIIRGILLALVSFSTFCVALALGLPPLGTAIAFATALGTAILGHIAVLIGAAKLRG